MNDRVGAVLATHLPELGAATGQEGTEVVSINENTCLNCQSDHRLWRVGVKELVLNLRVTVYLMAEVIQSIQKRLRVGVHAAVAGRIQRYSGNGTGSTELYLWSIRHYNHSTETHRGLIPCLRTAATALRHPAVAVPSSSPFAPLPKP